MTSSLALNSFKSQFILVEDDARKGITNFLVGWRKQASTNVTNYSSNLKLDLTTYGTCSEMGQRLWLNMVGWHVG